jgi:membrane-bound serine protease (ClpP class)
MNKLGAIAFIVCVSAVHTAAAVHGAQASQPAGPGSRSTNDATPVRDASPGYEAGGKVASRSVEEKLEGFGEKPVEKLVRVDVRGALTGTAVEKTKKALAGADEGTVFIVELSTSGGSTKAALQLSKLLLSTPARTVAFVEGRALGNGALVALSCQVVALSKEARLGALEIDQYAGQPLEEPKRRRLVAAYEKAARELGRPVQTVLAIVDPSVKLTVKKDVTGAASSRDERGLEGAKPGLYLWVGSTTGEKLGLAELVTDSSRLEEALGLEMKKEPGKKPDEKVTVERAEPIDPLKVVSKAQKIHVVAIDGTIDLSLAPYVERVVEGLKPTDLVILDIDTFGGRVDAAVRIRDALLGTEAVTVAFVNRRAISAGALIALACDLIAMTPGGSMGAATPIQIRGGKAEPTDEKVVSYMRKEMKSTAEANGRRGDIAEAMVDRDVEVKGIPRSLKESITGLKKGKLLTLTTKEATALGMIELVADDMKDLKSQLEIEGLPQASTGMNWAENLAAFLTSQPVVMLLTVIGFLGIMIEFYTPGFGIAGGVGVAALLILFFGHYVAGLAGWEHVLIFIVGVGLLAVEIFVTPGFGVLGIGGGVLIIVSLVMMLMGTETVDFDLALALGYVTRAIAMVMGALIITTVLTFLAVRYLPNMKFLSQLVLDVPQPGSAGTATVSPAPSGTKEPSIGDVGVTKSLLRPAGKVRFDGVTVSAVAQGEYIPRNEKVRVVHVEAGRVVVRKVAAEEKEGGEPGEAREEESAERRQEAAGDEKDEEKSTT